MSDLVPLDGICGASQACLLQMCVCFCELAGSLVDKTIPYVSAPLWSVPLPFPSANKNQSWLPMISINNYTGEIACVSEEKNLYCKSTTNNRNKRSESKAWQTNNRQHKPTEKAQCCSIKSHKTFDPDQAFQAEMQHSPPFLTLKKKYIHLATKSTQYTLHMCLTWNPSVPW